METNYLDIYTPFITYLLTYEAYYLGEIFSELPILAISVNNNENKFYWINQQTQTVERTDLGDFYEYETDWITEVTNPRVLLLSEH